MVTSDWFNAPWVYLVTHPTFKAEYITPFAVVPDPLAKELGFQTGQKLTYKIELRLRYGYDMARFEDVCVDTLARAGGRWLLRLDPTPMHDQLREFIFNRVSNTFKTEGVDVAARILDDMELRLKFIDLADTESAEDPDLAAESTKVAAALARVGPVEDDPGQPGPWESG